MLEIDRPAPDLNPTEILVTSANIDSLSWNNYEDVIFSSILTELSTDNLEQTQATLTRLSFWDNTLFLNIQTCLTHLPNLQHLCILTVTIDEATNINQVLDYPEPIEAPGIRSLVIIKDPKLDKDDYFLIDFFTRGVNFGNLEKFEFRGEDNFNFYSHIPAGVNSEDLSPVDRSILAKFLIKNRGSLKHLEIRGPGVTLFESLTEELQALLSVQVDSLLYSMDNEEVNYLVNQQSGLQSLTCHDYVYDFNIDKMACLTSCISRNASTLTSIQIFPNILYDEFNENLQILTTIDCRCFEHCTSLQKLQVNLELMNRRKEWESTKSGRVTNIASAPRSLRQFNIISESIPEEELEPLASSFSEFERLEFLCLESTVPNTFGFKLQWLRTLYELPQIKRILFNGAIFDDLGGTIDFTSSRNDTRGSLINDAELSIFSKG